MNDLEIRQNFHRKKLQHHHAHKDTLVIDELGLNHGKSRADIAVINGRFVGYEIKSDNDSLFRLREQIKSYNTIFDKVYIIVGDRYINTIHKYLPSWWGIIMSFKSSRAVVSFNVIRKAHMNKCVKPISIARLLWRNEALEILKQKQILPKILRQSRAILYQSLVDTLNIYELRKTVRGFLKKRKNWRCPELLFRYDDLCRPAAT